MKPWAGQRKQSQSFDLNKFSCRRKHSRLYKVEIGIWRRIQSYPGRGSVAEVFIPYHRKSHQLSMYLQRANVATGFEIRCDSWLVGVKSCSHADPLQRRLQYYSIIFSLRILEVWNGDQHLSSYWQVNAQSERPSMVGPQERVWLRWARWLE